MPKKRTKLQQQQQKQNQIVVIEQQKQQQHPKVAVVGLASSSSSSSSSFKTIILSRQYIGLFAIGLLIGLSLVWVSLFFQGGEQVLTFEDDRSSPPPTTTTTTTTTNQSDHSQKSKQQQEQFSLFGWKKANYEKRKSTTSSISSSGSTTNNNNIDIIKKDRLVAFVHVGKAGGNTVKKAYPRIWCKKLYAPPKPNKTKQQLEALLQQCYKKSYRDDSDSPLSQQIDLEIHLLDPPLFHSATQAQLQQKYTTFLFSIRNPITRLISAYNFLHPSNAHNSMFARDNHLLKTRFYKDCFPTLQDLVQTISMMYRPDETSGPVPVPVDRISTLPQMNQNDDVNNDKIEKLLQNSSPQQHPLYCQILAVATLQRGDQFQFMKRINIHMRANYKFYYRGTIQQQQQQHPHQNKEVFAVRTEHLWDDLKHLDIITGGTGNFDKDGVIANSATSSSIANAMKQQQQNQQQQQEDPSPPQPQQQPPMTTGITQQQSRDLCCLLWEEMEIYQDILNQAINLDYGSKKQSLRELQNTCRIVGNNHNNEDERMASRNEHARRVNKPNKMGKTIVTFNWYEWYKTRCPKLQLRMPAT